MTRVSLWLVILAVAILGCPCGAVAKQIFLSPGEGEDLSTAVAGASDGDKIVLRGEHSGVALGGRAVARYPVSSTLTINKNLTIQGEPGFLPMAIEIAGEEGETGNCSDALKNGFLDEGEGEPSWTQFPAGKVIVPETQVDLTPEGEGEKAFAALSDPNVAQFAEHNVTERATSISQAIGALGAPVAAPFVYELRYLFPIYPIPLNGISAILSFELQIQPGAGGGTLDVISNQQGVERVVDSIPSNAGYASYAVRVSGEMLDPALTQDWAYLTFRATVQDSDTRFYVDDVKVGVSPDVKPVLDGGFEPGVLQALWTQNSASDPILVQENPSEGEWSARFGQAPGATDSLDTRQFLHFYYRVDRIKTGDFLNVQINGASLGDPVHVEAVPASAVWRSVSRNLTTAEAAAGATLKFVTTGSGIGTFSIDNVYVGPVSTNFAPPPSGPNRLQNWDFETWPQTQWVSEPAGREAIIFSPAETGGYWPSHGFARLGGGQDLAFRDISLIEQLVEDIPDDVRYLDFYLQIANPDPRRISQFEVWLLADPAVADQTDRLLAVAHDETPGFGQWQKVRLNVMPYRNQDHKIRFVGRVYSGSDTKFFVDNICMPTEQFSQAVINITNNAQVTLWNLSVFGGTTAVRVTDGALTLRRCGVFDAKEDSGGNGGYGVEFANEGSGTLANCSISYNKIGVSVQANTVKLIECTLFQNTTAVTAAGGTVDSYACLVDKKVSTFAGTGTINSHQDWVTGGDYGVAGPPADPLPAELLAIVKPPYCIDCNEPYWPGNLQDRMTTPTLWPRSTLAPPAEGSQRDFENQLRAPERVFVGADEPLFLGAVGSCDCAVDAVYVGRGGQVNIYASVDVENATETEVFIVPQTVVDAQIFNRFDVTQNSPDTYILLNEPDSISPDGDVLFQFTVPFDQGNSDNGLWLDVEGEPSPICWEGTASVYVRCGGVPMELGCTFVIDTIAPILVESENDKDGRSLVTDHNDTCAPNIPLMPGWRPGLELMPFTDGTWATAIASATSGPQVFFNVNSQSNYVACASAVTTLSFQTELSFYDPYPADVDGDPVVVVVSGFNECGIDPDAPCTSDYEPGLPVWAEGVPVSEGEDFDSEGLASDDFSITEVRGSWRIWNSPFEASSWFPREARFTATDRAGNEAEKTPPLMLWWMQDAVIGVSGPGDPKDPVFTWRFVRPANPENATPCEPIFRYAVVSVEGDGPIPPIDRGSLLWSGWLSTANYGYRISRTTPYQGTSTFADAVDIYQGQGTHLILFVQAGDEAGNISEPTSVELVTDAGVVEGELYWPMPVGSGYKLTTRVTARFWHNVYPGNVIWDMDEPDFGGATRIPLPAVTGQRIEGQFNVSLGYPDTVAPEDVEGQCQLYRDGKVVISSDPLDRQLDPSVLLIDPVAPGSSSIVVPGNLSFDFWMDQGKDINYLFKVFTFLDENDNERWDDGEPYDPEGASVRFTVVSGRPVLDTQPIKLIVKGE